MSEAYLIVDTQINDPETYEKYKTLAKPIVESFEGQYIVRGGEFHVEQSEIWSPNRLVIIKFPNFERAQKFLNSKEYSTVKILRLQSSKATTLIVNGI